MGLVTETNFSKASTRTIPIHTHSLEMSRTCWAVDSTFELAITEASRWHRSSPKILKAILIFESVEVRSNNDTCRAGRSERTAIRMGKTRTRCSSCNASQNCPAELGGVRHPSPDSSLAEVSANAHIACKIS